MLLQKVTDYKVELSEYYKVVKPFIEKWHYSHSVRGLHACLSYCFGLFDEDIFGLPKLIGGMIYGVPSSRMEQKSVRYGNKPGKVLELNRLCCIDDTPTNTESYFIGQTLKWLSKNTDYQVVVSYADPDYGHGGTIYKATNFIHYDMTGTDKVLIVDGKKYHRRTLRKVSPYAETIRQRLEDKDPDVYWKKTCEKHIYIYYLDKKLKRKRNKSN
jgi:hypothetical protein